MPGIKIKASMEWKCPHCGLSAKGTLQMNGKAIRPPAPQAGPPAPRQAPSAEWFDAAWKQHLRECRAKASLKPAQEGDS